MDVAGEFLFAVGGELGFWGSAPASAAVFVMVLLLLVFGVLQQSHLLLEVLAEGVVQFASGYTIDDGLLLLGGRFVFDDADGLLSILYLGLGDEHDFEFIDFVEVGDQ